MSSLVGVPILPLLQVCAAGRQGVSSRGKFLWILGTVLKRQVI